MKHTAIAIVGCGYVADMYAASLAGHPELALACVFDTDRKRCEDFAHRWGTRAAASFDDVLEDASVNLVLNLTNPHSHFGVNRACLVAGKHVYSEKPLAMTLSDAEHLAALANSKGLYLASAPCSVLSDTAQTLLRAVRQGTIGRIRAIYASFDDGMIAPRMSPWLWRNAAGVPWPAKDEFEVGCTFEHAGYLLTWLAAMFGPAIRVTAFSSCQIPDKGIAVDRMAPDFSLGCIEYRDGVVARVTISLVAPRDRSITIIGDDGVLFVGNVRDERAPVMLRKTKTTRWKGIFVRHAYPLMRWLEARVPTPADSLLLQERYPPVRGPNSSLVDRRKPVDFLRGPVEVADAIDAGRPSRLSAELGVHLVELIEVLQHPTRFNGQKDITTQFAPIEPLPWAV